MFQQCVALKLTWAATPRLPLTIPAEGTDASTLTLVEYYLHIRQPKYYNSRLAFTQ
jgi:hypothetical protein